MIPRILAWLLAAIVIIVVFVWIIGGGITRSLAAANKPSNPLEFFGNLASFKLPWQPSSPLDLPTGASSSSVDTSLVPYDASQAKTFGYTSPYAGKVAIVDHNAAGTDPSLEYVEIQILGESPVSLSGWSLQSAYSRTRALLPSATENLVSGTLNKLAAPDAPGGSTLYIVTGKSPVGVSFRENICSGYLAQFQQFTPPLEQSCPNPADELTITGNNLRSYGPTCIDFVQSLSSCHFPTSAEMPANISPECRDFASSEFSYNGCVTAHRDDAGFLKNSWRLYLNSPTRLWDDTHDVIRLLDDKGQIVDAITY